LFFNVVVLTKHDLISIVCGWVYDGGGMEGEVDNIDITDRKHRDS